MAVHIQGLMGQNPKPLNNDRMVIDFGAVGREAEFLGRLQGRKFLVKGNHDRKSNQYYRLAGFEEVYDHPVII